MALENQISMYSVDTSNFYSTPERKLHQRIMSLKVQRNKIKELKLILRDYLLKSGYTDDQLKPMERGKYASLDELKVYETVDPLVDNKKYLVKRKYEKPGRFRIVEHKSFVLNLRTGESELKTAEFISSFSEEDFIYKIKYILKLSKKEIPALDLEIVLNTYEHYCKLYRYKQVQVGELKKELLQFLKKKVDANKAVQGKHHLRVLDEKTLRDKDIICVFESALNRYIGLKKDDFTDSLLVVQVYFFDIFKDIVYYGFTYKGEKYRYFTSSAGQIRTKKAVFIKEETWNRLEKTLMCGLTIDKINEKGGNNVNKHLAYLALTNSATDLWTDFDIDKSIVIEDFETNVPGLFDLIDETDYSIKRIKNVVPITHTDGAGMMLPTVSKKNFMVRLPWVKGLLGVFDFRKFIEEHKEASPFITDIYGKTWDIFKDDIQIIFTKSQFKAWAFYSSWEEYKDYYKKYNCTAGYCNKEEDRIKNSTINYQMLQTFTDFTEDEVKAVAAKSIDKIKNITSSVDNIKEAFGATIHNCNMSPLQKSIYIYPDLLNDAYLKEVVRSIKDSLIKRYRAGHLEVRGKYTFLVPDFYACCEHWFMGKETPQGLLKDQEVYCRLFPKDEKLDCLRSPHLYKEHAVRWNMAYRDQSKGQEKTEPNEKSLKRQELEKWFITDAIYTSSWDLISKILQFDDH